GHVDVDGQALDGHRTHQFEREPGEAEAVARPPLDRPGGQRGHCAAVLVAGIPRPPGVPGRDEVGAAGLEQRLDGHPRSLPDGRSGPVSPGGQPPGFSTTETERITSPTWICWVMSTPEVT